MTKLPPGLQFPDVSIVLQTIEDLKALDLRTVDFTVLKDKIHSAFRNVPMVHAKIPAGTMLYRARLFPQNSDPYSKVTDIGVPPNEVVTSFGRANKPNEPLFYASSNIELAMNEICRDYRINLKDYQVRFAVVGEWRVKSGHDISVSNLCYNSKAQTNRDDLKKAKAITEALLKNKPDGKSSLPEKAIIGTSMLLEFFSDEFAKENIRSEYDYKISAAYMDLLMDFSRDIIQGVNYPSVATNFAGDNIVLTKKCFEDKLELLRAFVVAAGFYFHDERLNMGAIYKSKTIHDNKIIWEDQ